MLQRNIHWTHELPSCRAFVTFSFCDRERFYSRILRFCHAFPAILSNWRPNSCIFLLVWTSMVKSQNPRISIIAMKDFFDTKSSHVVDVMKDFYISILYLISCNFRMKTKLNFFCVRTSMAQSQNPWIRIATEKHSLETRVSILSSICDCFILW